MQALLGQVKYHSHRSFRFLLRAAAWHEQRPRHAADDGCHAALAGERAVGLVELQRAGGQVDLGARALHGVDVEVVLLTLQIQPAGSGGRDRFNDE